MTTFSHDRLIALMTLIKNERVRKFIFIIYIFDLFRVQFLFSYEVSFNRRQRVSRATSFWTFPLKRIPFNVVEDSKTSGELTFRNRNTLCIKLVGGQDTRLHNAYTWPDQEKSDFYMQIQPITPHKTFSDKFAFKWYIRSREVSKKSI